MQTYSIYLGTFHHIWSANITSLSLKQHIVSLVQALVIKSFKANTSISASGESL